MKWTDRLPHPTAGTTLAFLLAVLSVAAALSGQAQAPLTLFNGTSLLGWNAHGGWSVSGGALSSGAGGERSVITSVPFADLRLDFDFNASGPMGSRLRLWTDRDGNGGLNIDLDPTGSPAGVGGVESLSHSSLATVSPGWHHVQVEASSGHVATRVDGQPSGSALNLGTRGGYLGFAATRDGSLQVRAVRLVPLGLAKTFNGADLGGWKSVARTPDAKGGVSHDLTKTFTFGIGGGNTKPHEAKWSVVAGAIHGEDGPGGLENANALEDGIIQIAAAARGTEKKDSPLTLSVRTVPGQLGGGYLIGIGPDAGQIGGLAKHAPYTGNRAIDETIVFAGRSFSIWVDGALATARTDTRAENSNTDKGAKISGGALTLELPAGGEQMDVFRLQSVALPRSYGLAAKAPPPPQPIAQPVAAPATPALAPQAAPSDAEKALLAQQQANARKDADDQANKQRVASLMGQALATTDPQQQMAAYQQVVQIDPSNAAAVQGFKEAQARAQAQQQQAQQQASAEQQAATRSVEADSSLAKARSAFLSGHLAEASAALSVAERFAPSNPAVRDLRSRLGAAQAVRTRLYLLGGGAGLLGTITLLTLWLRRRKLQRFPVLEVVRGLESGRSYSISKDTTRIGAVAQNGGQKNDIVLQDIEHAISRFHCEIARKNGQLYVTDLKSANGTRLNGESLQPGQPQLLRRGNTITLADSVELRFDYNRRPQEQV